MNFRKTTPFTFWLCIVLVWFYILRTPVVTNLFACNQAAILNGKWWTLLTYSLLHGGLFHLLANLFGLTILASIEPVIGSKRLAIYYACGCLAGGVTYLVFTDTQMSLVGASAGICTALAIFCCCAPQTKILFMFIPIKAWQGGALFVFLSLVGLRAPGIVAHSAHLAGMAVGALAFAAIPRQTFSGWQIVSSPPTKPNPRIKLSIIWLGQAVVCEFCQVWLGHSALMVSWSMIYLALTFWAAIGSVIMPPARAMLIWISLLIIFPNKILKVWDAPVTALLLGWALGLIVIHFMRQRTATAAAPSPQMATVVQSQSP